MAPLAAPAVMTQEMNMKMWKMMWKPALVLLVLQAAACSSIAQKTNNLSDDKIKSQTGGALGYMPEDLTLVSRRTEGTNTYVALKAKDGKEFNCIVNGGNLLSMGMTNPPVCSPKGQPVKAAPFGQ
jgi:hypothetical protein